MPETLDRVEAIFASLLAAGLTPVTLLVVPGRDWQADSLARLRALCEQGAVLAGHGWNHRVEHIRGWRHRLHSALISRDVAEHLALDEQGIIDMLTRCHDWFTEHALPVSELYVPPAWALGHVHPDRLAAAPFRLFETFLSVYDSERRVRTASPMVGFEADTTLRRLACSTWNAGNLALASPARPVRLGIHPSDPDLLLGGSLEQLIQQGGKALGYDVYCG